MAGSRRGPVERERFLRVYGFTTVKKKKKQSSRKKTRIDCNDVTLAVTRDDREALPLREQGFTSTILILEYQWSFCSFNYREYTARRVAIFEIRR